MNIADRFAHIEAEYKAIEKLYKAAKAEALEACYAVAGDDLTATVDGDNYFLEFSLTAVNSFSAEKAKAFLTDEQIAACMVQNTRQNLKPKTKAKIKIAA